MQDAAYLSIACTHITPTNSGLYLRTRNGRYEYDTNHHINIGYFFFEQLLATTIVMTVQTNDLFYFEVYSCNVYLFLFIIVSSLRIVDYFSLTGRIEYSREYFIPKDVLLVS